MSKLCSFVILCLLFSACSIPVHKKDASKETSHDEIVSLYDSTKIIRELIRSNQLSKVLEDIDESQLEILINNTSPAQMALEAEVLQFGTPVFLAFFNTKDPLWQEMRNALQVLVQNKEIEKIVEVDAQKLPTIIEQSVIEAFPAVILIKDRQEIARLEGSELQDNIVSKLKALLEKIGYIAEK